MSIIKNTTQPTSGEYLPTAPQFVSPTPANATAFTTTAGTNATYATFAAVGGKGSLMTYQISGNIPTGITLNPDSGVLSGFQPTLTYGHIGSVNADIYGAQNNITLTGTYSNPVKNFSFTVTAREFNPSLGTTTTVTNSYTMQLQVPHKFRQIITRGYTLGGYQNSVTYRNCNQTIHATDTTTSIGDLVDRSFNYKVALVGHSITYAMGTTNAHNAYSNYTSAFNMRTETQAGNLMNGSAAYGMAAALFSDWYYGWCTGGGFSATEEFNLTTQTLTSTNIGDSGSGGAAGATGGLWAMNGETFGITYDGGYQRTFTYSTRAYTTRTPGNPGNSMQQKAHNSKNGFGWAGGDGSYNGGYFFRKTNMTTNTLQSSNIGIKPAQNTGEENPDMGQDVMFVIGTYDGSQNNRAYRYVYATDSGTEGGATMQSKGVPGRSSAVNGWRD